ncbi:MAG: RNA polymerase sigma factor [bacterium]|nr:RNA polymerase sigma factor [bacterium]
MNTPRKAIEIELLVLEAQSGNPEALAQLAHRYNPTLTRRAAALTQSPEAAADIAQDTWVAIARSIRKLRDPARFHAWATSILTNTARDWIKAQIQQREHAANHRPAPNASAPESTGADELRQAILTLEPKLRDIVILIYMDRCTTQQAAAALAIPTGTAKSRLRKARDILRTTIETNERI